MNAEYLVVYNRCYGETVEALNELFPKLKAVSTLAFIVKTVDAVYRSAFVISS